MSKVVGLIGGMSWQTTAVYYREINQRVASRLGGLHSANILIRSLNYDTLAGLVTKKDFNGMTELFCKYGLELKAAGAEALVLCANVAHKAAEPLEQRTGLPVLHIVDFTGRKIVESKMKRVGLLATRAVMEEDFYKARLKERYGLEVFVPADENFRAAADHQIFNEMSKNTIPEEVKTAWYEASASLVREYNVDCIVFACTELRLLFGDSDLSVPTFETTMLHARGVADWALGE